jgi:hypothetical protein
VYGHWIFRGKIGAGTHNHKRGANIERAVSMNRLGWIIAIYGISIGAMVLLGLIISSAFG